jgi:hypothetical protein|tara:strand:+ start:4672 stop:5064 length:393 start_codon:yes stop_codon:yes gene_type:complete
MTKYARITSSTEVIIEEKDEAEFRGGKPPAANVAKNWEWLPLTIDKPSCNSETEVLEGPEDVVTLGKITRKYTVRDKTPEEINLDKDLRIPRTDSVQYKIMFDQENRVRKLEGLAPTTDDEFRVLLRSKV